MEKIAGTKHFDCVIMNPPYSISSDNIHLKFVDRCLDISDKQIAIFPISFIKKQNIKTQDIYKEKWKDNLVSIEEVSSNLFSGTAMPNCGIYEFDNKKHDSNNISIKYLNQDKFEVDSLLNISKFTKYEQNIEKYFKDKTPINAYNLGYFMPLNHLKKDGITDINEIKNKKIENANRCVKKLPDNKIFLICNSTNGGMNGKFFTPRNGQIINGKEKLIEYIVGIDNVSNGYNAITFNSKKAAENCKIALQNPLLRFLLYRLQQDQRMTIKKCYKYVPNIDWSNDKTKTDEGILELCGCPKDKCKEYADYCKKIINEVDKKLTDEEMEKIAGTKHFNICLMNPPYSGSLHLKFLEKVINISDKVVSVQPATFLINTRTDGKAKTQYIPLKNKLEGHVKSCEINNMNSDFKIGMKMPCTIISIDFTKNYNEIEYNLCNDIIKVNSIYDCNLVGDSKIIQSILSKITESKYDKFINNFYHYSKKDKNLNENTAYCPVSSLFLTTIGSGHNMNNDKEWQKDDKHNTEYIYSIISSFASKNITNYRSLGAKKHPIDCIYYNEFDSYEKNKNFLENYYKTVKTSNFFHFIGLSLIIDDQGACVVLKFSPILNYDHIYSDDELYKLFNITKEEQELIENTCKKFERQSKFIKTYWNIK